MPSVSGTQRRFLFATKGAAWVKRHHFDRLAKAAGKRKEHR